MARDGKQDSRKPRAAKKLGGTKAPQPAIPKQGKPAVDGKPTAEMAPDQDQGKPAAGDRVADEKTTVATPAGNVQPGQGLKPARKGIVAGFIEWVKERVAGAFNSTIEGLIAVGAAGLLLAVVTYFGWSFIAGYFGVEPEYPPAYDENAAKNPNGPYHFMPMVDYARNALGMEVNWDPPIVKDSTAILYPKALSVQKLRGNVLEQFEQAYPHCLDMTWSEVRADQGGEPRQVVTLRLGRVEGPGKRAGDPRKFYACKLESKPASP
ncbi:hypothetical protein ACFFTN_25225 [Aminobacter aganoensis]|uniref:Uncharacterized protein n=1 Tax=Aminobacter aganoensis TaxID=83264 RepID=A0A7X0KL11_9HYPH|nr:MULTISPECIES: hypothetical protein [Aminobacter]KQU75733.1 hypothetical protein ASC75_17005 [Aminobacter sp. DSM 101952]MBB6354568.1 hypothetical protein [Aminobacter aganoensis]